jgi:molecular chaperone IbpA
MQIVRSHAYPSPIAALDQLHRMVDSVLAGLPQAAPAPDVPPYELRRTGEDQFELAFALAGYDPACVDVVQEGDRLRVSAGARSDGPAAGADETPAETEPPVTLHRGIPRAAFTRTFQLAEHIQVAGARLHNGLLTIALRREVPEARKPRRIEIAAA